jgi:hypothetical protein
LYIEFNEESGGKVPVIQITRQMPMTDYEAFITDFKRLLQQHGKARISKKVTNVPTELMLLYLIRHGATGLLTSDNSAAGQRDSNS